ncbi:hypothetical protein KYT91_1005 (plasmid) [Klebsiella pneumoniae]|uniref:Uncharacterized protein n=2 Tax=Klebsiella pneumoniae TaxID=573 RepID=A0A3Q8C6Y5_KLEPN|nr:hypothetical protein CN549_0147 [Klebsiella pneumoniae]QGF03357.1 hypothetical protein pVir-SCNJ1-112 [Klebsiella pneumoniae subsp. pneumoniae]AZZ86995.1 hypothetical protein [Klebsiella pneumoniae]QAR16644.1 hypothetical protein [Klebsiella pneumoniae]QEP10056.1 hypothetical protein [Klebsiella pneumoniae]
MNRAKFNVFGSERLPDNGIRQLPTGDMVIYNNAGQYLICAIY